MKNQKEYDEILRVILIGDANVGKSSMMIRYAKDTFQEHYPIIGYDFQIKDIERKLFLYDLKIQQNNKYGKRIRYQVWDSAGGHRFMKIPNNHYKLMKGAVFVYDITDRISFQNIKLWIDYFMEQRQQGLKYIFMIVGNKCDLEIKRVIKQEEGQQLADSLGFQFLETSSKSSKNVKEALESIMDQIYQRL